MGFEQTDQDASNIATKFSHDTTVMLRKDYKTACQYAQEMYAIRHNPDANLYICELHTNGHGFNDGKTLEELPLCARLIHDGDQLTDGVYFPLTTGLFRFDTRTAESAWQRLRQFANDKKFRIPSVSLHGIETTFGRMYERRNGSCTLILPREFDIYHTTLDLSGKVTHHLHSGRLNKPLLTQ